MAPDAVVATAHCLPYGQRLTYWPLRAILLRLTRIEDDASSQQIRDGIRTWLSSLVEYAMQPRGDLPLMFVALARPELLDRRPGWGGGRRNYLALTLEPLSDSRADGSAFFAGELVRSVVEQVPSLADVAAVDRTLATLPDTVQATLLARIDLLEPDELRVLQLAAVLGRSFRASGIAAIEPVLAHDAEPITE